MKQFLLKLSVLALAMTPALSSYADPGITFDGPKITDRGTYLGKERGMTGPGDFTVYPFVGSAHVDAAVPQIRVLWGMENKNNWPSATPNTYFNTVGLSNGGYNLTAVHGQFDGDGGGVKDVVVLDTGGLRACYNFNGSACASESNDVPVVVDPEKKKLMTLWSARVADFNGDGKDDVAVIGFDYDTFDGWVAVVAGTNTGGNNPFTPDAGDPNLASPYFKQYLKCGIPLAVTVGQFGGDAKPDLAVSTFNRCTNTGGANVHALLNTGGGFDFKEAVVGFKRETCDKPTGLTTYNPDGAGQEDLVLTCYDKYFSSCPSVGASGEAKVDNPPVIVCSAGWKSGPVMSLQNNGSGTGFSIKQTLGDTDETSLKNPYTSTTGDYDGDGNQDLAIASNSGAAVVTYAGTSPFQVNPASRNDISTLSYTPKFIQTQDMNSDGLPDLILTASGVKFPEQRIPEVDISHGNFVDRYISANVRGEFAGKYYAAAELTYQDKPATLNHDSLVFARSAQKLSPTEYKFQYAPNSIKRGSQVLLVNEGLKLDGVYDRVPVDIGDRVQPTDGVIVLINHRPGVSGDDPKCGGGEVTYRCTASEGNTITECTPATTDAAVTFTPAVAAPGNKEWSGKVKLPNDQGVHKWTVTAKDNLGTVTTGEFTADFSNCPGGSTACPATPIEKQLSPRDPVMICAFENDQKLAELNSGKTVSWTQVGSKGIDLSALTVQGQCLVGPRLPLSFDQDRVIELKYSVDPDGPKDCPAKFVFPKAFFEGSGMSCSLNAASGLAASWPHWAAWGLPVLGLWALRKRSRK